MQEQLRDNHRRRVNAEQVPGWGVDADPYNDPTYPIKTHVDDEHEPYKPESSDRPDEQSESVEVLHSNERPNLPSVFGTTLPPSGLSGMIRRAAFTYSENSYGHWLPLMLADRVEMVEGVVDDLAHGHIPNVFSEMGWKADWKYNRKAVITKVAIGSALAVGVYALIRSRRNRAETEPEPEITETSEFITEITETGLSMDEFAKNPGNEDHISDMSDQIDVENSDQSIDAENPLEIDPLSKSAQTH